MANIKSGLLPLTGVIDGVRGPAGKDGNPGVWVGTEPPESSEYEVWVNPDGDGPIISFEWDSVENKPFETLSDDFEVDSEGVLNVVGGTGGASSWEDLENKPFSSIGSDLEVTNDTLNISTTVKTQLVNAIEDVSVGLSNLSGEVANKIDDPISKNSGDVLTYDGSEWVAQAGGSDVAIDNATIVENEFGNIETAIGGKWVEGKIPGPELVNFDNNTSTNVSSILTYSVMMNLISKGEDLRANLNTGFGTETGCLVDIDTSVADTYKLTCNYTITRVKVVYTGTGDASSWSCIRSFSGGSSGFNSTGNSFYCNIDGLVPSPIVDGRFIPIDNSGIKYDSNNNLTTGYIIAGNGSNSLDISYNPTKGHSTGADGIHIGSVGSCTGSNSFSVNGSATSGYSSAIGTNVNASGQYSFAAGYSCAANRQSSVAIGTFAYSGSDNQVVLGKGNKYDNNNVFIYILGNANDGWGWDKSDALAIDRVGNQYIAGDIYVGCSDYTTNSSGLVTAGAGGTKLARIPEPPIAAGTYTLQCISDGNGGFTYNWV